MSRIEMYSKRWCPYCRKVKTLLKSKGLDYIEHDIEEDPSLEEELLKRTDGNLSVPQLFVDGEYIGEYEDFMNLAVSDHPLFGNAKDESLLSREWDVVILGAGPAGLTAAIYAARMALSVLMIGENLGGQVLETEIIDNYTGEHGVEGATLIDKFWDHVNRYDVQPLMGERIIRLQREEQGFSVKTKSNKTIRAHTAIIATGAKKRGLRLEGETKLKGKGIHYCSICDGFLYAGRNVTVVGGGNAGVEAAIDLLKLGCEVTLLQNEDKLRADRGLIDRMQSYDKVQVLTNTTIEKYIGENKLEAIVIKDVSTQKTERINTDAVFIEIGWIANASFCEELVKLNPRGEIVVNKYGETNVPGVFAAGDATDVMYKQIIISAGEGAKAALRARDFLNENKS